MTMADKNPFGGGNANSLYVPMSEDEQEVIARLAESGDLHVIIVGWGIVHSPKIVYGDLRLAIPVQITFDAPNPPIFVHTLDLELRTGTGYLLCRTTKKVEYNHQPLLIGAGTNLSFIWDIAVQSIDPKLVKALKPGATGLTSRLQDKDTGQMTQTGNMRLGARERALLRQVRAGEARVRTLDAQDVAEAKKKG